MYEGKHAVANADDVTVSHSAEGFDGRLCGGFFVGEAEHLGQSIFGGRGDGNQLIGAAGMGQEEFRRKGRSAAGSANDTNGMFQICLC